MSKCDSEGLLRNIRLTTRDYVMGDTFTLIQRLVASGEVRVGRYASSRVALERVGRLEGDTASAEDMNRIVTGAVAPGRGLYIKLLQQELDKRGLSVRFTAHDLIDELEGKPSSARIQATIGDES